VCVCVFLACAYPHRVVIIFASLNMQPCSCTNSLRPVSVCCAHIVVCVCVCVCTHGWRRVCVFKGSLAIVHKHLLMRLCCCVHMRIDVCVCVCVCVPSIPAVSIPGGSTGLLTSKSSIILLLRAHTHTHTRIVYSHTHTHTHC